MVISYTPGVWNAFYSTDVKPNGKVWDMYSDIPGGAPPYEYIPGTNQCGSGGGGAEGDCYSREHSFPKSWFDNSYPMNTDLFHIFPVDQYVNNRHSNYPYRVVASPTWVSLNGSKVGPCTAQGYSGTVFEPIDEYKGDFARAYFYMATRYENLIATWPGFDPNAAAVLDGTAYPAFKTWYLDLLVSWHTMDPVSEKEIARNDSVYKIQHNRNPYIDHPEYVNAVWIPAELKQEPTNHVIDFEATPGVPPYNTVNLNWTDATGIVTPDGYLIRGSSVGFDAILTPLDGVIVGDAGLDKNVAAGSQAWTFSGLSPMSSCFFKIFPYTNTGSDVNYKTDGIVPASMTTTTAGISILQPGDLAIIELNSSDPDKFSFIVFKQLSTGTVINFTDNGFISPGTVRTGEGFLTYTSPSVVPAGTVISWRNGMNITGTGWSSANPSNFLFAVGGDQVFAYQGTWGSGQTVLCGTQLGWPTWLTSGTATSNTSYLPSTLVNNITATTFADRNGNYNLIATGSVYALSSLAVHPDNWIKSPAPIVTPTWNFIIDPHTVIDKNASVQNLFIGSGENVSILPGIILIVSGDVTLQRSISI